MPKLLEGALEDLTHALCFVAEVDDGNGLAEQLCVRVRRVAKGYLAEECRPPEKN